MPMRIAGGIRGQRALRGGNTCNGKRCFSMPDQWIRADPSNLPVNGMLALFPEAPQSAGE
jgi:hypothetical protein